jgi:hypothetical protein
MKSFATGFLAGIGLCALFSFSKAGPSGHSGSASAQAEVAQVDGYYIFADALPQRPYESLGKVRAGFFYLRNEWYPVMRNHLIDKARRKISGGEGMILRFDVPGVYAEAEVIRFK